MTLFPERQKTNTGLTGPVISGVAGAGKTSYLRECLSKDYWVCFQHPRKNKNRSTLTMRIMDEVVLLGFE